MKQISIGFLLTFLLLIIFSSCKEDKWADWKLLNDQWYAKHKTDSGFVTTSTGLCYQVIHQGYLRKPNANSYVVLTYKGKLIDGSVFDEGTETNMGLVSSLVSGMQEGLEKMNNGGTYRFYIPSSLGYGTSSSYSAIPPNSVLIFDVYLVDSYN
jgi:FKBP-type peptidyl-prolyl cis-trans isomerases 1